MKELDQEHEELFERFANVSNEQNLLEAEQERLSDAEDEAELHRTHIEETIDFSHHPSDLWTNESNMFVVTVRSGRSMHDRVHLILPEGEHTLELQMHRKSKSQPEAKTTTHQLPLPGLASYKITLEFPEKPKMKYRDPRELFLQITSSDPEFDPINKKLLSEKVPPPSASSTGFFPKYAPLYFPNQFDLQQKENNGVLLNRMNWSFGQKETERFDIEFEFRLTSDGPEVISTHDWNRYQYLPTRKKLEYLGAGRYKILTASKKETDSEQSKAAEN